MPSEPRPAGQCCSLKSLHGGTLQWCMVEIYGRWLIVQFVHIGWGHIVIGPVQPLLQLVGASCEATMLL